MHIVAEGESVPSMMTKLRSSSWTVDMSNSSFKAQCVGGTAGVAEGTLEKVRWMEGRRREGQSGTQ